MSALPPDLEWSAFLVEYSAHRDDLESTQEELPRQLAAAARHRIDGAVTAVGHLQRVELGGYAGLFVRHAFECWLAGLYLCLAADRALMRLAEADLSSLRTLVRGWPESRWHRDAAAYGERAAGRLAVREMASEVSILLAERSDHLLSPLDHYGSMYRVESRTAVHSGLGTLPLHLELSDDVFRLSNAGLRGREDGGQLAFAVAYASHLGGYVWERFGFDPDRMWAVTEACVELFSYEQR